tara:strand:+ start:2333 stop:2806 length:474 start_codon:yes stop_codon:yes gene_type:complete
MVKALYPGTFDPVHNGHVDIVSRSARLFEIVYVGIYEQPEKSALFSTKDRVSMFKESVEHIPNVEVQSFRGLAVNHAKKVGAVFILRGLRAGFDFETEFEMALMWRKLSPKIDVICMMSSLENQFIHSSRVKEVVKLGANVSDLVPQHVVKKLKESM